MDIFKKINFSDIKVKLVIAVILVVAIVLFIKFKPNIKKLWSTEKAKVNAKLAPNSSKEKLTKKKKVSFAKSTKADKADDDESSDKDEIDEEVRADAEELFGLVHEGLARGMTREEFSDLVGDLADSFVYIQLKQLYNDRTTRNMNPLKTISVVDYIKILKEENKEETE